jgi:hypothetical protein
MNDKNNREKEGKDKEIQNASLPAKTGEKIIHLGNVPMIDLTGLTEEQIQEVKKKQADVMIDVQKKMAELGIDTQALAKKLETMAEHTKSLAESGSSITITSTSNDTIGRTEIIIGTSDAAKKGKLTRSQTGEKDYTLVWVGLAVFVIIIVMIIVLAK